MLGHPLTLSSFRPRYSSWAYRLAVLSFHPVPAVEHVEDAQALLDFRTPFLPAGVYSFGDTVFDLAEPGTYRLFNPRLGGRQMIVLPQTLRGIAQCCADIVGLGKADRDKPFSVIERTIVHRRILSHCKHIAHLGRWMAQKAGHDGRVWLLWNHKAVEAGDVLSSHAITELFSADRRETRLFDLSFGVEMVVEEGSTDFLSYRKALIANAPVSIRSVCADFGYGYGSSFFEGASDDFEYDYLGSDPNVLVEAHRRLAIGEQIQGSDGGNPVHIPKSLTERRKAERELAYAGLDTEARRHVKVLADGVGTIPPYAPSDSVLKNGWAGHAITEAVEFLHHTVDPPSETDVFRLDEMGQLPVIVTTGSSLCLEERVNVDLPQDSCVRVNRTHPYGPVQILQYTRRPAHFLFRFLESFATGGTHTDFQTHDLLIAARARKVVTQGVTRLKFVLNILDNLGLRYRAWQIPTPILGEADLPIETAITLVEIGDGAAGVEVVDLDRRRRFLLDGEPVPFAVLEAAAKAGRAITTEPVCKTPGRCYASPHPETGISTDFLDPLWYATDIAWRDTLGHMPAIARQSDGTLLTTQLSYQAAGALSPATDGDLARYAATVLRMETILKNSA